jgi:Fe-S cluster assembly protein SufD
VSDQFDAAYEAIAGNGGAAAPSWLRDLRERAMARFRAVGLPATRLEQWRLTNVQPIAETSFRLDHAQWRTSSLPAGVEAWSLREAIARHPDLVRAHLAHHAQVEANPFTALSTALLQDGLVVRVAAGSRIDRPIELTCRTPASASPMVHPRLLMVVERGAQAQVVEAYEGAPAGASFVNAVTEIVLDEGARLDVCREQRGAAQEFHVATSQSLQGRDSQLTLTTIAMGATLTRHDLNAVLDGTGATLVLSGLSLLDGRQHVDQHTTIDHARPHCESHEYFNGVFDGESHGVFSGRIIVRPGAQRTDSKQTNNNLLLSSSARADSQPQLEIYADDVKCTHGSTVGPLDETALFYLRSRGVGAEAARGLLTYGFGAEILDRVAIPDARARLDGVIRRRLGVADVSGSAV